MTALPRGALLVTITESRDGATWTGVIRYTIPVIEAPEWRRRLSAAGYRRSGRTRNHVYPAAFAVIRGGACRFVTLTKGGDCP